MRKNDLGRILLLALSVLCFQIANCTALYRMPQFRKHTGSSFLLCCLTTTMKKSRWSTFFQPPCTQIPDELLYRTHNERLSRRFDRPWGIKVPRPVVIPPDSFKIKGAFFCSVEPRRKQKKCLIFKSKKKSIYLNRHKRFSHWKSHTYTF